MKVDARVVRDADGGSAPSTAARVGVGRDLAVVALTVAVGAGSVALAARIGGSDGARGAARVAVPAVALVLLGWFTITRARPRRRRAVDGPEQPVGRWLPAARVTEDGIHLAALPAAEGCRLGLHPCGATVAADGPAFVLPWDRYRPWSGPGPGHPAASDPAQEIPSWTISPFVLDRDAGAMGIAVEVTGPFVHQTEALRAQRRTWRDRFGHDALQGVRIPVVPDPAPDPELDGERAVLAALCLLLAERPELRGRLGDAVRMRRLLDEMGRRPLPGPPDVPLRRRPFEVTAAMTRLGYTHVVAGRPLPGEELPEPEVVVGRLTRELRANPFTRDLEIDRDQVRAVVEERYLVEAWPFAALLD